MKIIKNCLICNKEFETKPSLIKIGKGIVCSQHCAWEKISKDRKGIAPASKFRKGNIPWNKNKQGLQVAWNKNLKGVLKVTSGSFKKGVIPWNKGISFMAGEKNPRWKGGISKTKYYRKMIAKKNSFLNREKNKESCKKRNGYFKIIGRLTVKDLQGVYENNIKEFGTLTCSYCIESILFGVDTIEHIMPLSRGGSNSQDNLCVVCRSCNSTKRDKSYEEFLNYIST